MLSVVVIGKNEGEHLPRLISSLEPLKEDLKEELQSIYVDSASTDSSVNIASTFFDEVYVLENSSCLCAAAGRYIGTLNAKGNWILYLDGDMELCDVFSREISTLINKPLEKVAGFIGRYVYYFDDGSIDEKGLSFEGHFVPANYIGGAVLIKKSAVINAGNWRPSVFAHEEKDLYSRVLNNGEHIHFVNWPMINHFTDTTPKWKVLKRSFFPNGGLGKKFYGIGQLLAARVKDKNISSLIKLWPYPFLFHFANLIGLLFLITNNIFLGMFIIIVSLLYVTYKTSAKNIILYPALLVQAIFGWKKYNHSFIPAISHQIKKTL